MALDPAAVGGVRVVARSGPVRDRFLSSLKALLPAQAPWRKVPAGIGDDRLVGGLDLAATLRAGRPVAERGVLAQADGGVVIVPMAERAQGLVASRLGEMLDHGEVIVERDGVGTRAPARAGLIALDEAASPDEDFAPGLADRLAFRIALDAIPARHAVAAPAARAAAVAAARARLGLIVVDEAHVEALCATALALGIDSLRAPVFALRVARLAAALAGRARVADEDATLAARLVLAHRATRFPSAEDEEEPPPPPPEREPETPETEEPPDDPKQTGELDERILDAVKAVLPADVLERLIAAARRGGAGEGRKAAAGASLRRGRPAGVRPGDPRGGGRLSLIATLRQAAPWQRLRGARAGRIEVRRDDLRIKRFETPERSTTIFVVDASGSSALNRLGEAKGAVELLLARSYVRRDEVALVAFRGRGAELVLPPTRSLTRAKKRLAGLPGGGGTPLASGLETALQLALSIRRRGAEPRIVLLTDGAANVARDGTGGRAKAEEDALAAARLVRGQAVPVVLIDTAPRPQERSRRVAEALGARYAPLPNADARGLDRVIG